MARVLVVDDNDDERELYARMLYYNGFDVAEAADPITGLELARADRPDLILMDYRMPRMDGLNAAGILRAMPETSAIPVVCVTGQNVTEDEIRAAGCREVIRKPLPIHELIKRVRTYIDEIEDQHAGE